MNYYNDFIKRVDEQTLKELNTLSSEEIKKSFNDKLTFGTAGIRGVQGLGTNKFNKFTVIETAYGLGKYLLSKYQNPSVVVAFDTRHNSDIFASIASHVLANLNVKVYKFKKFQPTSLLTYSVISLKASAGVMITSSHNSKEYNGIKIVNEYGIQINDSASKKISSFMKEADLKTSINLLDNKNIDESFENKIIEEFKNSTLSVVNKMNKSNLKILYTALNGTGINYMPKLLKLAGFKKVREVKVQQRVDPDFTTCPYPNPELTEAFYESLKVAKRAEIIVANDPDADRFSCMVRNNKDFIHLTGNQIGILLLYHILKTQDYDKNAFVVTTVVSTSFVDLLCKKFNVKVYKTLTGFKNIGEKIREKESTGKFLMAFEESCGYIVNPVLKDKCGLSAILMFCQLCGDLKKNNQTVFSLLDELYKKLLYVKDYSSSVKFNSIKEMTKIIDSIRSKNLKSFSGMKIKETRDFLLGYQDYNKSNFIQFLMQDKSYVTIRPSGTEPKLKYYFSIIAKDETEAKLKQEKFLESTLKLIK